MNDSGNGGTQDTRILVKDGNCTGYSLGKIFINVYIMFIILKTLSLSLLLIYFRQFFYCLPFLLRSPISRHICCHNDYVTTEELLATQSYYTVSDRWDVADLIPL